MVAAFCKITELAQKGDQVYIHYSGHGGRTQPTLLPELKGENGFDEALFTGPDGAICEGSITNIGFIDGETIVWPDGPALNGIMMQVLQRELDRARVPWRRGPVHLPDLPSFGGAFVTNSHGMATVARIDEVSLPTDAALMRTAERLLAAAPYDPV